jgi:hypothetical protein
MRAFDPLLHLGDLRGKTIFMSNFFGTIHRLATKIETWWSLCSLTVGAGIMSWIAAQWHALAAQGWAAIIIVALLCSGVILGAAALVFLSISKWQDRKNPKEEVKKAISIGELETSSVSIKRGLYVGEILAGFDKLQEDYVIEISIRAYNGTGGPVSLSAITGAILYATETLPPPVLLGGYKTKGIPSFTEMIFVLEQRVPNQLAMKLLAALAEGTPGGFDLRQFNIVLSLDSKSNDTDRLPVFSITFKKHETIAQGRIVYL